MLSLTNSYTDDDMRHIDREIRRVLTPLRYSVTIRSALTTLLDHPGKRFRPMLVTLAYRLVNPYDLQLPDPVIKLAAAIELIHSASLIHDDIIDSAELRHGRPAFYKEFGTEVAIPVGVLLYSVSLNLLAQIGDIDAIRRVSRAVDQLCVGELDQVMSRNRFDLTVTEYLLVLKKKTSALFALSAWGGVRLAGGDMVLSGDAFQFGNSLGLLFQVSDDMLDFSGQENELNKDAFQDFLLGEITLPMIMLLRSVGSDDNHEIRRIMETRDWAKLPWLIERFMASKAVDQCAELVDVYESRCVTFLEKFEKSPIRDDLARIVGYISHRAG